VVNHVLEIIVGLRKEPCDFMMETYERRFGLGGAYKDSKRVRREVTALIFIAFISSHAFCKRNFGV
jgi:hypothetical protein